MLKNNRSNYCLLNFQALRSLADIFHSSEFSKKKKSLLRGDAVKVRSSESGCSFNMGHHTKNSNISKDSTLRLCSSLHDFFLKNLKSGKERQGIFLSSKLARSLYNFFLSNAKLVTQTIITCNYVVKPWINEYFQ